MKRRITAVLALMALIPTLTFAEFDPSIYSEAELYDIIDKIYAYIPKTPEGTVLCNEQGVYVEFRGIYKYSSSSYIVNLYVDNTCGEDVYLSLRDGRVNRASIGFANNGVSIQNNSIYLASANFDMIIDNDDLEPYGISTINSVDFTLNVNKGGMFGDSIIKLPVSLTVEVPIS